MGVVVLDSKLGTVLPLVGEGAYGTPFWGDEPASVSAAAPAALPPPAIYMTGEYLLPQTVRIVSKKEAIAAADARLAEAREAAGRLDCDGAEKGWADARRFVATDRTWKRDAERGALDSIVGCIVAQAAAEQDPLAAARLLWRARFTDPKTSLIDPVGGPLADRLDAQAQAAFEERDWEAAYAAYRAEVQADPTRALAKRRAEDIRDRRLKIRDYDPKKSDIDPNEAPLPRLKFFPW
jgi:hypothetical protein